MRWLACPCAAVLLAASPAAAQEETLIEGDFDWDLFGGLAARFTEMVDEFAVVGGARAGLIANHTFAIGIGVYGLVSDLDLPEFEKPKTDFIYGGLELEYVGKTERVVHYYVRLLAGGGAWSGTARMTRCSSPSRKSVSR